MQHDKVFELVKRTAECGSDQGEYFDKGVLSVVQQISQSGQYKPYLFVRLLLWAEDAVKLLSDKERELCDLELRRLGMTVEQASCYASGVQYAEFALLHFKRN